MFLFKEAVGKGLISTDKDAEEHQYNSSEKFPASEDRDLNDIENKKINKEDLGKDLGDENKKPLNGSDFRIVSPSSYEHDSTTLGQDQCQSFFNATSKNAQTPIAASAPPLSHTSDPLCNNISSDEVYSDTQQQQVISNLKMIMGINVLMILSMNHFMVTVSLMILATTISRMKKPTKPHFCVGRSLPLNEQNIERTVMPVDVSSPTGTTTELDSNEPESQQPFEYKPAANDCLNQKDIDSFNDPTSIKTHFCVGRSLPLNEKNIEITVMPVIVSSPTGTTTELDSNKPESQQPFEYQPADTDRLNQKDIDSFNHPTSIKSNFCVERFCPNKQRSLKDTVLPGDPISYKGFSSEEHLDSLDVDIEECCLVSNRTHFTTPPLNDDEEYVTIPKAQMLSKQSEQLNAYHLMDNTTELAGEMLNKPYYTLAQWVISGCTT